MSSLINNTESSFKSAPGFCADCGSSLPLLNDSDESGVVCYACNRQWGPSIFGDMTLKHSVKFKEINFYESGEQDDDKEDDGPIVEYTCPKCNNSQAYYRTMQLRSADEGQTVFYKCTKCKSTQVENS